VVKLWALLSGSGHALSRSERTEAHCRALCFLIVVCCYAAVQIIDVLHPNRGSVPKEELKEKLAKTYKVMMMGMARVLEGARGCSRVFEGCGAGARTRCAWP